MHNFSEWLNLLKASINVLKSTYLNRNLTFKIKMYVVKVSTALCWNYYKNSKIPKCNKNNSPSKYRTFVREHIYYWYDTP